MDGNTRITAHGGQPEIRFRRPVKNLLLDDVSAETEANNADIDLVHRRSHLEEGARAGQSIAMISPRSAASRVRSATRVNAKASSVLSL